MKNLSIIIPTKDRTAIFNKTLYHAIRSLEDITESEIIIVNDSNIRLTIDESSVKIRIVDNAERGVSAARNFGASVAKYENLIFLDNDFIISPESVLRAIDLLAIYPNDCFNFSWEYPSDLLNKISKYQFGRYLQSIGFTSLKGHCKSFWQENSVFINPVCLGSGFLAIRKQLFEKAGRYNENYVFQGEDKDLSNRLRALGAKEYICSECTVYHNEEDRVSIYAWMHRQYIGAFTETRNIADKKKVNRLKRLMYKGLSLFERQLYFLLKLIPNYRKIDSIYFTITDILLGVNLYNGRKDKIRKIINEQN
jgi:GT2 family glycosyltransferase